MKRALYVALGLLSTAAAVVVGVFLWGVEVDGSVLRAPLERVLTSAFDVPARIEGPLRLRTGSTATVSADALVLADPLGPAGAMLARGVAPRARIDLRALLRGVVLLEEVGGERLDLALRRQADGHPNWRQLFSSSDGSSPVSFAGIERLRIDAVTGSYQREGGPPVPFTIAAFDAAVPMDGPLRASGTARITGREIGFDLRAASLRGLGSSAGLPLRGTLTWSGVKAMVDGALRDGGARLEASVDASAADATAGLAALGVSASEPGAFALRGRLTVTTARVEATELAASVGRSSATGAASIAWDGAGPRLSLDLRSDLLDAGPFLADAPAPSGRQALELWAERLERLAAVGEFSGKLAAGQIDGLPVTVNRLRLESRSGERTLAAKIEAELAGTPIEATLDYDASKPDHKFAARIDSGAASTASLPGRAERADLAVTAGSIRGRLNGSGTGPAAVVASLQGELDARNIRWTSSNRRWPAAGRFDGVRISLRRSTTSAEVSGNVDGAACRLTISGGAVAPLLAGEPWPARFSATCPHERLRATGRIGLAQRHTVADLSFDLAGDRRGPVARAAGLPQVVPYPIAARGTLLLDAQQARLQLADFRSGRSKGSGDVAYPLAATGTPRLRLAFATLSLDEFVAQQAAEDASAETPGHSAAGPLPRVPDADFSIAAKRIEYGDGQLSDLKLDGAVRARAIGAAPFAVTWQGIAIRGHVGLDLGRTRPQLRIDAAAQDADLRPLLVLLGAHESRARAGKLSVSAKAQGERLRELLASVSLEAAIEGAQVELQRPLHRGAMSRGSIDATFSAAPDQPSRFVARGNVDGRPFELSAEGPTVEALALERAALPLKLRSSVGDIRLQVDGRLARGGSAVGHVRLIGGRTDRLGRLVGLALPDVAPYSASADVRLAPGTADFSNLQASFGKSRISGQLRVDRREGRRAVVSATLHAPVLNLEDIGAGQWLSERARTGPARTEEAERQAQAAIEQLLDLLPQADVEASVDIDALLGGGQRFASGKVLVSLNAGALHARLIDVRAQDGITNAEIRIDASAAPPRFSLRADAGEVEYGALARAMLPASQLDGQVSIVADLSAQSLPANLLKALQGTVDVAIYPRGMKSDALGVWGAGLLPAILRAVERDSQAQVHCSVLGFSVADGLARSDGFFVETTSVRIIGDLEINLGTWELAGRIDPRSNRAQLFAISPRMQIGGVLGRPSLSVARENVVLVPLRFASPLALFSTEWLRRGNRRGGGKADCQEAFERTLEAHHGRAAPRPGAP